MESGNTNLRFDRENDDATSVIQLDTEACKSRENGREREGGGRGVQTSSFSERRWTPKDSKAWRRLGSGWKVEMRLGGRTPDRTIPLAMLSAILPAPINPSLYVSVGIGSASMAGLRRRIPLTTLPGTGSVCYVFSKREGEVLI
ncbi:hypothetical protein EV1_009222 [Malus domestica]